MGYTTAEDYDNPDTQVVSCDSSGSKYALDVAKVPGTQIGTAAAALSTTSNQWDVTLTLKSTGATALTNLTSELVAKYSSSAGAGDRPAVLFMAQVLGHLLVQRGLHTVLVSCLSSPSGPVRDRPCSRARRTICSAAIASAVGSGFFFVTSSSVAFITAPLPLNTRLSDQGRKHR